MDRRDFGTVRGPGFVDLTIPQLWLVPGTYIVSAGILDSEGLHTLDAHHHAYQFSVASSRRNLGIVYLDRSWRHGECDAAALSRRTAGAESLRRVGAPMPARP
jgi:hypothetical protein